MPTYSDAEMRAIMGRALQIDSGRSERFTPEQLRSIAAELGISTQALEVALYEADSKQATGLSSPPTPSRRGMSRGVAIAVGVIVLAVGAFFFSRIRPQRSFVTETAPATTAPAAPVEYVPRTVEPTPANPPKTTTKKTSPGT